MPECSQIHNCGRETPQNPASDKAANLLRELREKKYSVKQNPKMRIEIEPTCRKIREKKSERKCSVENRLQNTP
jgi:chromosome condensin MukBEF ATPase and DNA-binding subunit MukB